ncbi:hypothetical protein D9756_001910 [Leucocoprinus leucothites]|uniref:Uncharacterized protein n=1 Tax=Leucocoprinus leucothites TaxID=201217 RepID=A0A8H5LHX7_9AGAR|nr:hypothetical protein D9756_001910 [Leucoagaricus leucothites]
MAYPSSSSFPPHEQSQLPQPPQSAYQSDSYHQQDFTPRNQSAFGRQWPESVPQFVNWTQEQNDFPQATSQQFPDQQNPYPQQSSLNQRSSFSQPDQFLQQNPSQSHQGQQQSHTQYAQHLPPTQYLQQPQQPQFTPLSQNQPTQSTPLAHQNTQRNQQNVHSQQTSLAQPNQLPGSGAHNPPNGFSQHTQHGQQQQHFLPAQPTHMNQQNLHQQGQQFGLQTAQQPRGPPFPQLPNQPVQRSQSLPYPSQPQPSQTLQPGQQSQLRHSSGDVAGTFQLFFTGRDDPRSCMLIGEDTKPVYLSFETQESNLNQQVRTNVYKNTRDLCAKLDWGTGGFLGTATIGNRQFPMAHLVLPGSTESARRFTSIDGKQFEWRRIREDATAYDVSGAFRHSESGPSLVMSFSLFLPSWLLPACHKTHFRLKPKSASPLSTELCTYSCGILLAARPKPWSPND